MFWLNLSLNQKETETTQSCLELKQYLLRRKNPGYLVETELFSSSYIQQIGNNASEWAELWMLMKENMTLRHTKAEYRFE